MNERILVFIPAYKCAAQIGRVLAQIKPPVTKLIHQVIVVDNISPDNTLDVAIEHAKQLQGVPVSVLRNNHNYGLGGSIKVAINYAKDNGFDYLLVLHGDDQASIADFEPVLRSGVYKDADLFMGARFHPQSTLSGYDWIRINGNRLLNLFCSIMARRKIYDLGSGLNIYKVASVTRLPYLGFPNDLTFDPYMIVHALRRRLRLEYAPISWREYDQVSNAKIFRQGAKIGWLFLTGFFIAPKAKGGVDDQAYTSEVIYHQ